MHTNRPLLWIISTLLAFPMLYGMFHNNSPLWLYIATLGWGFTASTYTYYRGLDERQ